MGCAPSLPLEDVFRLAVVDMLLLCAGSVIRRRSDIKIVVPYKYRRASSFPRLGSESFSRGVSGESLPRSGSGISGTGSMLLGREPSCTGIASEKTWGVLAGGLELSVSAMVTLVVRDILSKRQQEVIRLYSEAIVATPIKGALGLVRGKMPYGEAQYKAQKPDAITAYFLAASGCRLRDGLVKLVQPEVSRYMVTKAFVDGLKRANSRMAAFDTATLGKDVADHIAEQLAQQIGALMGQEEARIRSSSARRSQHPQTFAFCFSGESLTSGAARSAYQNRSK